MTVALSYFTVVQNPLVDVETGTTSFPLTAGVLGTVSFTPSAGVITSTGLDATVILDPIVGRIVDGALSVGLVDNVDLGLADGELTYLVDYWLNQSQRITSFRITAPGDGTTVDLNDPTTHLEA